MSGTLTSLRWQREEQVRLQRERKRARGTYFLETAEGGTSQDTERKRSSQCHPQTRDRSGRDTSELGKKLTEPGGTYVLGTIDGETSQDT